MRQVMQLPLPVAYFLTEEAGTSLMEIALVGLLVIVVGTLIVLAFDKCT